MNDPGGPNGVAMYQCRLDQQSVVVGGLRQSKPRLSILVTVKRGQNVMAAWTSWPHAVVSLEWLARYSARLVSR
jgi:hypothetical protein